MTTANNPLKILIYFPNKLSYGGIEYYILSAIRNIDPNIIHFDLILGTNQRGVFDDELIQKGCKLYYVPERSNNIVGYAKKLKKIRKEGNYQIIHFHADNYATSAVIASWLAGFKVRVAHSHNTSFPGNRFKNKLKCFFTSFFSNKHLACSEEAGKYLFGKKKFTIIHPGVDLNPFRFSEINRRQIRDSLSISNGSLVVGCIGHLLESHKNQSFLIGAMKEMATLVPNPYLILFGEGDGRVAIEKAMEREDFGNVIFVSGNREKAGEYCSAFDVFSLPSHHEGLGIACIESIANGLYCVNSDNVPVAKKLEKYEIRLSLFDSPSNWAKALLKATRLRTAGNIKAVTDAGFDDKTEAKALEDFYLSLK